MANWKWPDLIFGFAVQGIYFIFVLIMIDPVELVFWYGRSFNLGNIGIERGMGGKEM